jgi:hypothetical protein
MAGVLESIRLPQKRLDVRHDSSAPGVDLNALELQAAKEILAEIFGVRITDVEGARRGGGHQATTRSTLAEGN